jgi:hypothetical protein
VPTLEPLFSQGVHHATTQKILLALSLMEIATAQRMEHYEFAG